jgi:DNA transposition AAA+ family ATPase
MSESPIEKLIDSNRIKGASRIIADGASPESITEQIRQAVSQAIQDYIVEAKLSRSAVARSIGISTTTMGQLLNGNYSGHWQQLTIDLDLWLEQQRRRDAASDSSGFIWTGVATEIKAIADAASTMKCIGLVYGPESAGMGKTLALKAIAAMKPGAVLVTLTKVDSSAAGLLQSIEWALQLRTSMQGGARGRFKRIKERLAGTSRMLLIDQIHTLCHAHGDKPLYVLADLYDATGAPQLWCGTSDIVAYLQRGQAHGEDSLAQIRRRIGVARDLCERTRPGNGGPGEPLYTLDEIRKVFSRGKMRMTPEAVRYLWQLANTPDSGALGAATNLVKMATAIYGHTGNTLTAEMLTTAHRMLVSRDSFVAAEQSMQEPARRVGTG